MISEILPHCTLCASLSLFSSLSLSNSLQVLSSHRMSCDQNRDVWVELEIVLLTDWL